MIITNVQLGRAIIGAVGEDYQREIASALQSSFCHHRFTREATTVLSNIEKEYVLNLANILVADKYDELPKYLKERVRDTNKFDFQ